MCNNIDMDSCMENNLGSRRIKGMDTISKTTPDLGTTAALNVAIFREIAIYNSTLNALLYTFHQK